MPGNEQLQISSPPNKTNFHKGKTTFHKDKDKSPIQCWMIQIHEKLFPICPKWSHFLSSGTSSWIKKREFCPIASLALLAQGKAITFFHQTFPFF